jgi:hypothetical protein
MTFPGKESSCWQHHEIRQEDALDGDARAVPGRSGGARLH